PSSAMSNFPYGNSNFARTDQRPCNLGFPSAQPLGFESQNHPRSRSPSYLIYTPSFISFKVTNLPTVYRFTMPRGDIREKSIRKLIKKAVKVKAKTLLMRDANGSLIRIDSDLILQYHIDQMESRQRRDGIPSEIELLIGDKYGSIIHFPNGQGWMQV
ncbi:hypothetical protein PMAYCL1PPCAC_28864, partial [Pristionchus mayeri]